MTTARSMARVEIVAQPEAVFCNAEGPIATYLLRVAFVLRCRSLDALESLGKVRLKFGLCAEGSRETFDKFLDLRPEKSTMELSKDKMSGQVFFRVQGICSKHLKQARFKLVIRSRCSHVAGTTSAYFLVLTKRRLLRKVHRDIERVRRREVHRVIDGFLQVFTPKLLSSACLGAYMTPFLKVCGISENEAPDHGYPMLDQQPQFLGPLEEPRWFKLAGAKTMVKVESTPLAPVKQANQTCARLSAHNARKRSAPLSPCVSRKQRKASKGPMTKLTDLKREASSEKEAVRYAPTDSPRSKYIIRNHCVTPSPPPASPSSSSSLAAAARVRGTTAPSSSCSTFVSAKQLFVSNPTQPPSQLFGFDDTLDMHDAIPGDAFVLMDAPCTENDKDYDTDSQASCVPENEITSDDADADFFHVSALADKHWQEDASLGKDEGRSSTFLKRLNSLASEGRSPPLELNAAAWSKNMSISDEAVRTTKKAEIAGQCGKKTEELKRADSLASYFDLSSWRRTSFSSHRSLTALPESGMDNFEPLRLDQVWSTSERGSHEGNDLADFII